MDGKQKIRVLIADDSFFIRTYLTKLFSDDPEIEVVGVAANGDEAVDLALSTKPDVVTMDYHMPGKNGLEATAAIMLGGKPLPAIIILSAFSGEEGKKVWRMLSDSGAHVIVKPSGEVSLDIENAAQAILEKVKDVGRTEARVRELYGRLHHEKKHRHLPKTDSSLSGVIIIGASTGGPPLIEHLLTLFRPDEGFAFIIVQHMSGYFTELFAERLDRVTDFEVRQMQSGDRPVPGVALVIPGDTRLFFKETGSTSGPLCDLTLELTGATHQEGGIDDAMRTIAHCYGTRTVGILLSGMGTDGSEGLRAIKNHGGSVIVQDPKTAPVSSMPTHALEGGSVDATLALEEIPDKAREILASTQKI